MGKINTMLHKNRQDVLNAFGKRMKVLRNQKGKKFSQEKLGEASGLHRNYISDAERGTRNVSLVAILKIIQGLDSTISEFFAQGFDNVDSSDLISLGDAIIVE
ncbi:helix-turn-helix transcriptional regulator [Spiroplasma endosymbiont of Nebria brevicollis]|uniref:helix-turn-helix domain-containing protein n=1 Tax=Spiroplasma endosymbiont of Nebria brevicollis TaxID=3066284 RepID=UPI00313F2E3C